MKPADSHPKRKTKLPKAGTEILYGIHPVTEAICAGKRKLFEIYASQKRLPERTQAFLDHAADQDTPILTVSTSRIKSLTGTESHQGIAARVGHLPDLDFSQLLARINHRHDTPPLLLILDGILDPHNLGALLRTAVCVDADGVIIPKDRSARPTPAVSKASAGALEHSRLVTVKNLVRTIQGLKQAGVWIFGLEGSAGVSIFSIDLTEPVAIVIGGEAKGVRRLVRSHCDQLVAIPQAQTGAVNSLNASVAGAIALYEVFRQRCR